MTGPEPAKRLRTPWHLWLAGGLMTLWNGFAAVDFTATATRFEPYISQFPQALKDYLYGLPIWMFLTWGIGGWGGTLGSILLLMRRKLALPALAASLAGAIGSMIVSIVRPAPEGWSNPLLSGVIIAIAMLFFAYALWMDRRGVLR